MLSDGRVIRGAPILPVELLDEIMTTAVSSFDPPSVSSIALVSHTYRILANEARFSSIAYCTNMKPVQKGDRQRLDNLADVLKSGKLVNTMPSIDAFITSFSLTVSGSTEELRLYLHNGSLGFVFDNLFRQSVRSHRLRSDSRKLSLEIRNWTPRQLVSPSGWGAEESDEDEDEDKEENDEETFLEWSLTDSPLTVSFIDLLLNSKVTHLHLGHIQNIPLDFLQGSKVQHLSFGDVSFAEPEEDEAHPVKEPIFVRLLCNQSLPMPNTFLFLTKVTFDLGLRRHVEMMNETLVHTPNLEYLFICLFGDPTKDLDGWSIRYVHLSMLMTLEFQIIDGGASISLVTQLLGQHLPPNLATLTVSCTELHNNETMEGARISLGLYPFNLLDKHLSQRYFKNLQNVVISFTVRILSDYNSKQFDVNAYKENYNDHVRSKFPLSLDRDPALNIRVPVVIQMDYGNGSINL